MKDYKGLKKKMRFLSIIVEEIKCIKLRNYVGA